MNPDPCVASKIFSIHGAFAIDPVMGLFYICSFLLVRGVSGDDPEGGAGSGVPRSWLVTTDSGGSETARRALRTGMPGAGCTGSAGNGGAGNADPEPKIAREGAPRGAASRSQGTPGAPRKRPGLQRHCRP